ncbi:MAG: hypothetical protein D8H92_13105 [Campylobacter sp.]|nr:MAG: hypothetical protein D8H92_13105 [Campylobacter sp.]
MDGFGVSRHEITSWLKFSFLIALLAAVFASYGAAKTSLFKRVNLPVRIKTNGLLGLNLTNARR